MSVEIKIPSVGESVSEVELGEWLKAEGDSVSTDETIVMLDSDKATVELPSPGTGVISKILKKQGESAMVGDVIAILEEGAGDKATPAAAAATAPAANTDIATSAAESPTTGEAKAEGVETPQTNSTPAPGANTEEPPAAEVRQGLSSDAPEQIVMPSAAREIAQNGLDASQINGTGPGGRVLKEDAQAAKTAAPAPAAKPAPQPAAPVVAGADEEVVRMTPLRRKIAQTLVEAQQTAALLTTFNEIDMSAAMELRKAHQDAFVKKHGVKLGFMSFFVKAAIDALKQYPAVNAEIRGDSIVYKNKYDIGVAIGGGKGLVVPILRNAERMSFAEIEIAIGELAGKVKANKITPAEMIGGTFTITNGGVYGSLLSTPIVNPPQSGILGMHTIQERPIAKNGQVVIAPMMYIALTYDHRIVDGREAVSFLKRIKECLENPSRMLLEV